jgi:hypothetical protein
VSLRATLRAGLLAGAAFAGSIGACRGAPGELEAPRAGGAAADRGEGAPTGADARAAASARARFVAAREPADLALLEGGGEAVGAPDAFGEVGSTFRAQVLAVHVSPGDVVRAGDPVVDVRAPELVAAAASLAASEAPLRVVEARAERLRQLRAEGLAEASAVFEAEARAAELRAARASAVATLRAAGVDGHRVAQLSRRGVLTLRAPVGGVVREVRATPGEVRDGGGEPFARIVGGRATRVQARFASPLPEGSRFSAETSAGLIVELGDRPLATLVAPADGSVTLWLPLPPDAPVTPGERVRVRARPAAAGGAPITEIPLRALRPLPAAAGDPRRATVVRRSGDRTDDVEVTVLAASGVSALVLGLTAGDLVVADVSALLPPAEGDEEAP